METSLEIKVTLDIRKDIALVFEAVIRAETMKNYFISDASGDMEAGKNIDWKFPEMDLRFPIQVKKTELNKYISYTWNDMDGTETLVEIHFEPKGAGATKLIITEKSRDHTEAGINWLRRNTEGWANFLACLKAWLEYGIHLREGAFDPMDMPE